MNNFLKIAQGVDVMPLLLELNRQPHLWNRNKARLYETSPHRETHDIWIRYNNENGHKKTGDYSTFNDPHESVWYPSYYALPSLRKLIFPLMASVEGERLGGVLIYNLPKGKQIYPHVDTGWHVEHFEKFNICLQSHKTRFCYQDEEMISHPGEVHRFRNDVEHWVINEGDMDHLMLTVCIHCHDYEKRYVPAS